METKHTPGPWEIMEGTGNINIVAENARYIATVYPTTPQIEANARLIAAAPELLEALTMALPYVETALEDKGYKPGAVDHMVKQIREAITAATEKKEGTR